MSINRIRENVDPSEIKLDQHNANKGTERGHHMLRKSFQESGPGRSIVLDADGNVIAGNQAVQIAQELGIEIDVIQTYGDRLIAHQRMDLDLDDPTGPARRMAFLDNRTSEVGLDWDITEIQIAHHAGLDMGEMFYPSELKDMGFDIATALADVPLGSGKDTVHTGPRDDPDVLPDQTYRCGEHVLTTGYSAVPGDASVMLKAYEEYTGGKCNLIDPDTGEILQ